MYMLGKHIQLYMTYIYIIDNTGGLGIARLSFLVAAEVDHAAQERAEALGDGLPEVLACLPRLKIEI